jgi:aryl-alcohol dehydrogenase-like predicted oxidoreductase
MTTDENWSRLGLAQKFAEERGYSINDLAIAWLLAKPQVGSVIAGVSTPEQLAANVHGAEWVMTDDEVVEVDQLVLGAHPVSGPESPPYTAVVRAPRPT